MFTQTDERATRVCHVVYGGFPWDPRVRKEVEALARLGYEIDVLCIDDGRGQPHESQEHVRVRRLPLSVVRGSRFQYVYQYLTFFVAVAAWVTTYALRRRYRIVHVHSLPDFLIFAALPVRLLGIPVVLDLHESMPDIYLARFGDRSGSFIHRLTFIIQRLSCRAASRVITVNTAIGAILESNGVPRWKVEIVENAPAWGDLALDSAPASGSSSPYRITIVGGLNPERDFETVLRAATAVKSRVDVRWRIIGYGDEAYRERLNTLAKKLAITGIVAIEPEVPPRAVPALLTETTIGIVSYVRNPLTEIATPNKAYEYALLGKPMVVADLSALRNLFEDTVFYFPPGDAGELANRILDLLSDPGLRARLGASVRTRIHTHRWEIMERRLAQLYALLAPPPCPYRSPVGGSDLGCRRNGGGP